MMWNGQKRAGVESDGCKCTFIFNEVVYAKNSVCVWVFWFATLVTKVVNLLNSKERNGN